tara:strand:- start:511 stop:966 length:456 start_codon:yes stop_codon:yes gene_type:complete
MERPFRGWIEWVWRRARDVGGGLGGLWGARDEAPPCPFLLTVRTGDDAATLLSIVRSSSADEYLDLAVSAFRELPRARLCEQRRRLERLLQGERDQLGRNAFALTMLVSALQYCEEGGGEEGGVEEGGGEEGGGEEGGGEEGAPSVQVKEK